MSSFSDFLEGKYEGSFEEYLADLSVTEMAIDEDPELTEEQKTTLKKIMRTAKAAYDKAAEGAKAIYAKAAEGAKGAFDTVSAGIKEGGRKVADGTVKIKDAAVQEIGDTIEEIKENQELTIKVAVASAVATAAAIGLASLIFRKRK